MCVSWMLCCPPGTSNWKDACQEGAHTAVLVLVILCLACSCLTLPLILGSLFKAKFDRLLSFSFQRVSNFVSVFELEGKLRLLSQILFVCFWGPGDWDTFFFPLSHYFIFRQRPKASLELVVLLPLLKGCRSLPPCVGFSKFWWLPWGHKWSRTSTWTEILAPLTSPHWTQMKSIFRWPKLNELLCLFARVKLRQKWRLCQNSLELFVSLERCLYIRELIVGLDLSLANGTWKGGCGFCGHAQSVVCCKGCKFFSRLLIWKGHLSLSTFHAWKQVQWNVVLPMRHGYMLAGAFRHWTVVTNAFFPHLDISIAIWSGL